MAAHKKFRVVPHKRSDGRTSFYARFTDQHGKRQDFPIGHTPTMDADAAAAKLSHIKADVERGTWTRESGRTPQTALDDLLFSDLAFDWWADWTTRKSPAVRTQLAYKAELDGHIHPALGKYRVVDIQRSTISDFAAAQVKKGLSASYINSQIQRIGQIYAFGMHRYDKLASNPARGDDYQRVEGQRRADPNRWLDPDQVELLLHAAGELDAGLPQKRVHWRSGKEYETSARAEYRGLGREALIATLCFAGLRNTEACNLTWGDIRFDQRLIQVRGTKTKHADRDVNLVDGLMPYLIAHRNQSKRINATAPVWPTETGKARNKDLLGRHLVRPVIAHARRLLEADEARALSTGEPRDLDITLPDDVTPHTFRRAYCGFLTEVEKDPDYVRGQMGHGDPKFTQLVYNRVRQRSTAPDPRVTAWMSRPTPDAPASRLRLAQ